MAAINKLMVAIPTLDYMHNRFVESLVNLERHLCEIGIEHDICFQRGTLVYIGRDKLVKKAVDEEYSHVLWLDADMVFEPDVIDILMETDSRMTCGLFRGRHDKKSVCLYSSINPCVRYEAIDSNPELLNDILEVDACGFGCVLTEVELLKQVFNKNDFTCFMPTRLLGEDLAFCERVKELGETIYCNPKAVVGHIGNAIIKSDRTVEWL